MKDYYSLLGVETTATKKEIKTNYRLLANKYHPDKSSDPGSAEKFIVISEAYEILSNPKSRTQYDLLRWAELKQKKASSDNYNIVVPPFESTRTRRNKAQQKRSLKFHQEKKATNKSFQLVTESFHIASRYISHILGTTILLVILVSAINHLFNGMEKGLIRGTVVSTFIAGIIYCIFWIGRNAFEELKKDFEAFSVFYKIPQNKAITFTLSVLAIVLLFYITFLKVYF